MKILLGILMQKWGGRIFSNRHLGMSFKYFGSMLTNDGRCTCEIKFRIATAKARGQDRVELYLYSPCGP